jgi:membrane fusion protein, multidrug efflux system
MSWKKQGASIKNHCRVPRDQAAKKQKQLMKFSYLNITTTILVIALLAAGCRQQDRYEVDPQTTRDTLEAYRRQIEHLQAEVRRMEGRLNGDGSNNRVHVREPLRVRTQEIAVSDFEHYFRVNGSVEAVRNAIISPETNGQMSSITVSSGERVGEGRVVARLNTSVIERNIEEVKTQLEMAETVYQRQQRLWKQGIGSEMQYLEAQNAYRNLRSRLATLESQLDLAVLRAPFAGIVDEIFIKEGELASPGTPVMQIVNLATLNVNADISERYIGQVNRGDSVILRFPFMPDFQERVPVYRLGNVVNPDNRSFRLQLRIANPGERLKPNMVANLSVRYRSAADVVVVPTILIKQDVQGHFVYLARENDRGDWHAQQTYIERGPESEGRTVIEGGLSPGDLLITDGHNLVGDGDPVRIINNVQSRP